MTFIEKAVFEAIKRSNEERSPEFNKGIKFLSMGKYSGNIDSERQYGDTWHNEYPNRDQDDWDTCVRVDDTYLRTTVECKFKPEDKWQNDIAIYEVLIYSNGHAVVYFDGTK